MVPLFDREAVRGSVSETEARLESYLASKREADGVTRLLLRVSTNGQLQGFHLDRDVRVEAWRERDDGLSRHIRVTWTPEGTVVFPKFSGTLSLTGDADPAISHIEPAGNYEPPRGASGEAFDAAISRRLAESTARALLEDVHGKVQSHAASRA